MVSKILILLTCFIVVSCNKAPVNVEKSIIYENNIKKDYELFDYANQLLQKNDYKDAINELDKIQIFYPNSIFSGKARLVSAYISFLEGEYEKTKVLTENFIKYYPGNKDIVYAYYLNAMTDYVMVQKPSFDQKNTLEAKKKLVFINNAFPENRYKQDIILKLNILNNTLAEQLLLIGKYYEKNNEYAIALNYYIEIFDLFENTLVIEETLYLIVENYLMLKEEELATKYASILGYNYPNGKWYKKCYNIIRNINDDINENLKWYQKLNPIKLIKREKNKNTKKWFEPMEPKFKIF